VLKPVEGVICELLSCDKVQDPADVGVRRVPELIRCPVGANSTRCDQMSGVRKCETEGRELVGDKAVQAKYLGRRVSYDL
jgi:hypothetical protein